MFSSAIAVHANCFSNCPVECLNFASVKWFSNLMCPLMNWVYANHSSSFDILISRFARSFIHLLNSCHFSGCEKLILPPNHQFSCPICLDTVIKGGVGSLKR